MAPTLTPTPGRRIYLGNDHAAIELRHVLSAALTAAGHQVIAEFGPALVGESVDYPDIAADVCDRVHHDPGALGLLLCGTGQGMAMAANKQPGIRAAVVADAYSAQAARQHNDANVLCLGARVVGVELAKLLLHIFLDAEYAGGRHARRVAKIDAMGG